MTPIDLAQKVIASQGKSKIPDFPEMEVMLTKIQPIIDGLSDITDSALTRPVMIQSLIKRQISGKEYVKALGQEDNHPIKILMNEYLIRNRTRAKKGHQQIVHFQFHDRVDYRNGQYR